MRVALFFLAWISTAQAAYFMVEWLSGRGTAPLVIDIGDTVLWDLGRYEHGLHTIVEDYNTADRSGPRINSGDIATNQQFWRHKFESPLYSPGERITVYCGYVASMRGNITIRDPLAAAAVVPEQPKVKKTQKKDKLWPLWITLAVAAGLGLTAAIYDWRKKQV